MEIQVNLEAVHLLVSSEATYFITNSRMGTECCSGSVLQEVPSLLPDSLPTFLPFLVSDEYFRMKLQWKSVSEEQERRNSRLRDYRSLIGELSSLVLLALMDMRPFLCYTDAQPHDAEF